MDIAVIGAGPYGLSVAAHLDGLGADFRVFGPVLDTWRRHMPRDMLLKSDGFASSLSAPAAGHELGDYCAAHGLPYHDLTPVPLRVFNAYATDFQTRLAPGLDERQVAALDPAPGGFQLRLEDGERLTARRVVLAIGITHFDYRPPELTGLPTDLVTHSGAHSDFSAWRGRSVAVIGAGSSAVDTAVHLHEAGARISLVARRERVRFGSASDGRRRTAWQRLRHPGSGLGPGWRSRLFSDAPDLVRLLPAGLRLEAVRRHLGPSSPGRLRGPFEAGVSLVASHRLIGAEPGCGGVRLRLATADGGERTLDADHVIAATGYRADLARITFMAEDLRREIRAVGGMPRLSRTFESSVPGLHFVGLTAAGSFGPLMRFMYGADFAARRVSHHLVHGH